MAQMMMGFPMMMAAASAMMQQQQQQNYPATPTFEKHPSHARKTSLSIIPSSDDNYPATPTFKKCPSHHGHARKTSLTSIIPSSDDIPDFDSESPDYPLLFDWLKGVDEHPTRGRDKQDYPQWAIPLQAEGYLRLDDFQQLSAKDLRETCDGMNAGTARRLISFAKEDVERLDKESRRARKRSRQS